MILAGDARMPHLIPPPLGPRVDRQLRSSAQLLPLFTHSKIDLIFCLHFTQYEHRFSGNIVPFDSASSPIRCRLFLFYILGEHSHSRGLPSGIQGNLLDPREIAQQINKPNELMTAISRGYTFKSISSIGPTSENEICIYFQYLTIAAFDKTHIQMSS